MPRGEVADSPAAAAQVATRLGCRVAVKAQVLTGGRGKAGGVKLADTPDEARAAAAAILGMRIKDNVVGKVLIEEALSIESEFYASFTTDRAAKSIACILSAAGGVDIEEVAANEPGKITTLNVNPLEGLQDAPLLAALENVFPDAASRAEAADVLTRMYELFIGKDCSLVEVNPLVTITGGGIVAADAKIVFEDNGLEKHPELEPLRNAEEYSEDELEARAAGLSFVSLEGSIGCMVNGAGLAMATMDLIKLFGAEPANFLDVGGSSNPEKVLNALRILLHNEDLAVILVNIFGGITRCDDVARGLLMAREQLDIPVPMVVRLIGTNEKEGRALLEAAGITASGDMTEAVRSAVAHTTGEGAR